MEEPESPFQAEDTVDGGQRGSELQVEEGDPRRWPERQVLLLYGGRNCMRGQTTCRVRSQELLSEREIKEIWVKPYIHRSHEMS